MQGRLIIGMTLLMSTIWSAGQIAVAKPLRVMTFNIWVGGESGGQPLAQSVKVIEAAEADIVGLQESHGERRDGKSNDAAKAIADLLGWHYFDQGDDDCGIISRYEIVDHTPKKWGAAVELPSGKLVWVFNAHFAHTPYQPYQLLKIPYNDAPFISTEAEAIDEARKARGEQVTEMLKEINAVRHEGTPIFVTGDFNEPSSLDWTEAAALAGKCPIAARWPTTAAFLDAGFVDAYRQTHSDPITSPGNTWTPITAADDPNDRHERIDFVLVGGAGAKIDSASIIGESPQNADVVVAPYPSDHRAVVATFDVE